MKDIIEIIPESYCWRPDYEFLVQSLLDEDALCITTSKRIFLGLYKVKERINKKSGKQNLYVYRKKLADEYMAVSVTRSPQKNPFSELPDVYRFKKRPYPDMFEALDEKQSVIVESRTKANNVITLYKKSRGIKSRGGYEIYELKEGGYLLQLSK